MLLLLIACTASKDSGEPTESTMTIDCPGEATVAIGDGAETFTEIAENTDLVMTHGPQGGWHMLASVLVENLEMIVTLNYTIDVMPEMTRISDNNYRVQLKSDGACKGIYWNMYGYLDTSLITDGELDTPPELLCGKSLQLTITASDSSGKSASDSVTVIAAPDPTDTCGSE